MQDTATATYRELQFLNSAFHLLGCKWSPTLRRVVRLDPEELPHPEAPPECRGVSVFRISVKPSGLIYFRPKAAQLRLLTVVYEEVAQGNACYIAILKARQIGFTTLISLLILALSILKEATNAMVAAHVDDSAYSVFEIYKRAYKLLPDNLRPKKEADNLTALKFAENQSSMRSFVAKEGSLGVSKPHTYAHFSEYALWKGDAGQTLATALDSIAKLVGALVFIETTSRGRNNAFFELWEDAAASWDRYLRTGGVRTSQWRPFFASWMDDEDYRISPPANWAKTQEEVKFQLKHRCDDAQLYWRNRKIAEKLGTMSYEGALAHFNRENPTTPEDAFAFAGDTTFDPVSLTWLRKKFEIKRPKQYVVRLAKPEAGIPGGAYPLIHNNQKGDLKIFSMPSKDRQYLICADPTRNEGEKPDKAAAHVLDIESVSQVAVYHGHVDPYDFADTLAAMGLFYNKSLIVAENNNAGLGTNLRLWRELKYPHVYFHKHRTGQSGQNQTPGFSTNPESKRELITNGQRYIRELRPVIHDEETYNEFEGYRRFWDAEKGKYVDEEAPRLGNNLIMALLIGFEVGNLKYRWYAKPRRFFSAPAPLQPEDTAITMEPQPEDKGLDLSLVRALSWNGGG